MKRSFTAVFGVIFFVYGCASHKEVVMPFRNYFYSADRLFPVKENNSDFTFRASVNLSTNVDRIFTISKDSVFGDKGTMVEMMSLAGKKKGEVNTIYNQKNIVPKSGFKNFINKVDSLNLLDLKNQQPIAILLHQPLALYIIEIKYKGKYNQFRFNKLVRDKDMPDQYSAVEKLIRQEFDIKFYFDK